MCGGEGHSTPLRDQNILYGKSLPGMDWDRCQEVEGGRMLGALFSGAG